MFPRRIPTGHHVHPGRTVRLGMRLAGIAGCLLVGLQAGVPVAAEETAPYPRLILPGYRTVAETIRANPKEFRLDAPPRLTPAGLWGIAVVDKDGQGVIEEVAIDSPAEQARLCPADRLLAVNGRSVRTAAAARKLLADLLAGQTVTLTIYRNGRQQVRATLRPISDPLTPPQGPWPKPRPTPQPQPTCTPPVQLPNGIMARPAERPLGDRTAATEQW